MNQQHLLSAQYNAESIEEDIYKFWESQNFFSCQATSSKPAFCIMLPPPNVTGALHLGHALDHTIQDVLIRWKRMSGFNTLWQSGLDHAGIATQSVLEKKLKKEGLQDIGHDEFLKHAWSWKEQYSDRIISQMKRLGDSCDWNRNRFTLDDHFSQAVKKVFVTLYNEGLIYRDYRLVNWDTKLGSAVSDLEVEHEKCETSLWHFKYIISDSNKEHLVVATTRPETMLGDTAVCVHPEDERYKKYVGRRLLHPFLDKEIPIIADDFVDREFGSGVVKITPAHDFTDYNIGKKHKLDFINILNTDGTLNQNAGLFQGLSISDVKTRDKVVSSLNQKGLLVLQEPYTTTVPISQRSGEIIEPFLSKQWFVRSSLMANKAKDVIKNKSISFIPELWTNTYLHWMNHLQDWCISRQLWWGHRIPAWFCKDCEKISVSEDPLRICCHCSSHHIHQETDVLDTWFSSALWPFVTLGWPKETKELKTFYPTDVLVTGHDIIFFWVSRMIMSGVHHLKEIPFRKIYIHGIVRDDKGKKMSKTLGNTLDPIELIDKYGADALRLALLSQVSGGRDLKFSKKTLTVYRNFLNKIWNATRFSLSFLEKSDVSSKISSIDISQLKELHLPDQWIIYKLGILEESVNEKLDKFKFSEAISLLYDFVWHDFCDWYLEFIKLIVYNQEDSKRSYTLFVLFNVLNRICRLLHPFIPFVTEEIYQKLPIKNCACVIEIFPRKKNDQELLQLGSKQAAFEMDIIKQIITAIRNIRGENNIPLSSKLSVQLVCHRDFQKIIKDYQIFILQLAKVANCQIALEAPSLSKSAVHLVQIDKVKVQVIVPLEGLVNFEEEVKRLEKNIHKVEVEIQKINTYLHNPRFIKNAPEKLVNEHQGKLKSLKTKKDHLKKSLDRLL